jgi:hypothetical protein
MEHKEYVLSNYAPIAIFCYRRSEHLSRMLSSLAKCEGFDRSPLIVYGDGPRDKSEESSVMETREVAMKILGSRAEYFFSDKNMGLATSITSGVSDVLNRFGKIIVLEDDLELHPSFLQFMNKGLEVYAENKAVFQISGYMFDVPEFTGRTSPIFLPITASWGWATWARAWDQYDFESSGTEELFASQAMQKRFDIGGSYGYTKMLKKQLEKKSDSWAIRWYWSVFRLGGLVVFPPRTLVNNNGFDGSGTHGRGFLRNFSKSLASSPLEINWTDSELNVGDIGAFTNSFKKLNFNFSGVVLALARLISITRGFFISK